MHTLQGPLYGIDRHSSQLLVNMTITCAIKHALYSCAATVICVVSKANVNRRSGAVSALHFAVVQMVCRHHLKIVCACRANIKVSSTETGAIFGNIVYESSAYADRSVVVLNDIHIDIMDYISPASCPDVQFRSMWAEFEWENKVSACTMIVSKHHRALYGFHKR